MSKLTDAHGGPRLAHPDARALVCGTGDHVSGSRLPPIPAVRASVEGIQAAFVESGAIETGQIRCIVDPEEPAALADALAEATAEAETVLLFHYVGHGLIAPDGELHLATRSTGDLSPGLATYQALPFTVIREILAGCRAHLVVTILDCCFSGRATGWTGDDRRAFELPTAHGSYLLASAARNEVALAPEGATYTAFTGEMIRFLREGDPTGPRELTLDQLYRFLVRRLPELGGSHPHRQSTGGAGDLVLGSNAAYRPPESRRTPSDAPDERAGGADETSPYRGLAAFRPEDGRWFHGRETLTARLVDRLRSRLDQPGLLVVVGPSGAGKSSLIRAGLLPALSRSELPGSHTWPVLLLTPGGRPLEALASKLAAALDTPQEDLRAELAGGPSACVAIIRRVLRRQLDARSADRDARLVLIVDQLEEAFVLCDDAEERTSFVAALADAAAEPAGPLVILGLRADFYGHCAAHPQLVAALDHPGGQLIVGPMTSEELRDAIVEPAHAAGLELEDGLVDVLQRDVGIGMGLDRSSGSGGELPLLSHALLATWQLREGRLLTLAGYQAGGGIHDAIAHTAEEVFLSLDEAGQEACRRLMLRLVAVGVDTADTRRPLPLAELPELYANTEAVVESFVRTRLLTTDELTVQITHDAMLVNWPRLRKWIEEGRAGHVVRQQIADAARAWDEHDRDRSYLHSGARLSSASAWALDPRNADQLIGIERDFLAASTRRERRQVRRLRQVVAGLVTLLLLVTATTVYAFEQSARAEREADRVVAQALVDAARSRIEQRPDQALLLAAEAVQRSDDVEVRSVALQVIQRTAGIQAVLQTEGGVTNIRPLPSRSSVLIGTRLWDLATRQVTELYEGDIDGASFGGPVAGTSSVLADGRLAVVASGGEVEVHDLESGDVWRHRAPAGDNGVVAVDGDSSGDLVAWGTADGAVGVFEVWQPGDPKTPVPDEDVFVDRSAPPSLEPGNPSVLVPSGHEVLQVALSSDGRTLAVSDSGTFGLLLDPPDASALPEDADAAVGLWDLESETLETTVPFSRASVVDLAFAPGSGRTLATRTWDGWVQLWDTQTGDLVDDLTDPDSGNGDGSYSAIAFHPKGEILAVADADDGRVRFWSLEDRGWSTEPSRGPGPTGHAIDALAYTGDGTALITARSDGLVLAWDQEDPPPLQPPPDFGSGTWTSSGDGRTVVATGVTGIWVSDLTHDPPTSEKLSSRPVADFSPVALSHDGRLLALAEDPFAPPPDSQQGSELEAVDSPQGIEIWDVKAGAPLGEPIEVPTEDASIDDLAFSHDGQTLAVAGGFGTLSFWDVSGGQPLGPSRPNGLTEGFVDLHRLPDGSLVVTNGEETILWDFEDRSPHDRQWRGPGGFVAADLDGRITARVQDDSIVFWDEDQGRQIARTRAAAGELRNAIRFTFSRDSSSIAVAGFDPRTRRGTLSFWDVGSGRQLGGEIPTEPLGLLSMTPDGSRLVAFSSGNSPLQIYDEVQWTSDLDMIVNRLCEVAGRDLTRTEWDVFLPTVGYRSTCGSV